MSLFSRFDLLFYKKALPGRKFQRNRKEISFFILYKTMFKNHIPVVLHYNTEIVQYTMVYTSSVIMYPVWLGYFPNVV